MTAPDDGPKGIRLDIDSAEWARVNRCLHAIGQDDRFNPPVLARQTEFGASMGIGPCWRLRGHDGTIVEIDHGAAADEPYAAALPARLLAHAEVLADVEGGCSLILEAQRYAHLEGRCGSSAVFDLLKIPEGLVPPNPGQPEASASVGGGDLCRVLVPSTLPPSGFQEFEEQPVQLGLERGRIGVLADWSAHGGHRVTFRCLAATTGSVVVDLWGGTLADLVHKACRSTDDVALDVFAEHVRVRHDDWTAWAPRYVHGPDADLEAARRRLTGAKESVDDDGTGLRIRGSSGRPSVRVEAHHLGDRHLLRISTVLASNVADEAEVRRHLDALVRSQPGMKAWMEDGRAVVAYDLPASEVDVLPGTLSCFRDAVTGFDVLLAGDDPASRVFEPEHMFE